MFFRLNVVVFYLLITGCANHSPIDTMDTPYVDQRYFQDHLFSQSNEIDPVNADTLYHLPLRLQQSLDREVAVFATDLERLLALRRWSYQQVRYYQYDPTTTVTLNELDSAQKINCLSFSILFQAAADYVKVPAEIHLIDTVPKWDTQQQTWVYLQHISVISKVSGFYSPRKLAQLSNAPLPRHEGSLSPQYIEVTILTDINPHIRTLPKNTRKLAINQILSRYYTNKSAEALVEGDLNTAYTLTKHALTANPRSAEAWNNLGVIYARTGAVEIAKTAYEQSVQWGEDLLSAKNNLYSLYIRLGYYQKAEQLLAAVDKQWLSNPYFLFNLGETSAAVGDYKNAIAHYQNAIRFKNDEQQFYLSLAKSQIKLDQRQLAAKSLQKAEQLNQVRAGGDSVLSVRALLSKI